MLKNTLHWLRKPTASGLLVPQMEGLRFVALLAVFFVHFEQMVRYKTPNLPQSGVASFVRNFCGLGDFGVQLFFAVSGFVLALPFARWHLLGAKPVILRQYFLRRLWRLEPPLLLNLILLLPVVILVGKIAILDALQSFALTISYLHYTISGEMSPINRVTWSLETEAQFYLLMPLLSGLFRLNSAAIRRLLLVATAVVCMTFKSEMNKAWLPAQFEYFAIGILLADLYLTSWSSKLGRSTVWDVIGGFAWLGIPAVLFSLNHEAGMFRSLSLAVLVFLSFTSVLRGKIGHNLAAGNLITLVGGMCYSFYLYHDPVLRYAGAGIQKFLPANYEARFALAFLVLTPLVLAVTMVMYAVIERPFMSRKRNTTRE